MRYSLLALAASTLLSSAYAQGHNLHQRHGKLARRVAQADECVCSTYVTSYLVDYTPAPLPPVATNATTTVKSVMTVLPIHGTTSSKVSSEDITTTLFSTWTSTYTTTAFVTVTAVSSSVPSSVVSVASVASVALVPASSPASLPAHTVPTPAVTTIATPGVYTIPATTLTLTSTEYVCVPTTTSLAPGVHTYGGVTTIVETSTTVVCPLATVSVDNGVTTSMIYTTTYICPSAGTYIIGATTSTVTGTVTVPCEYPVPTAFPPGTYTQPEVVTTITVTSEVVTCPFGSGPTTTAEAITTPTAVASTSTAPATTTAAAVPTTAAPPVVTTSSASVVAAVSTSSASVVAAVSTSSTSVVAAVSTSSTSILPAVSTSSTSVIAAVSSASSSTVSSAAPIKSAIGGAPWAVTYSPYADDGTCRSQSSIEDDIAQIAAKGIPNIRIYSTDCFGLEYVGAACENHGLGMIMGIYIKAGGVSTGDSQVQDLITWGKWSQIIMLVIGNEAVFNGFCSASDLAAYIVSVSGKVKAAGYTGIITTAEPMNTIHDNASTLCSVVDVMGANIHPFFNSDTSADQAGTFVATQLALVEGYCNGKTAWVLETGWPSAGNPNNMAIPGTAEQATAVAAILSSVGGRSALFTWRNDMWKSAGSYDVEQYFGCGSLL